MNWGLTARHIKARGVEDRERGRGSYEGASSQSILGDSLPGKALVSEGYG